MVRFGERNIDYAVGEAMESRSSGRQKRTIVASSDWSIDDRGVGANLVLIEINYVVSACTGDVNDRRSLDHPTPSHDPPRSVHFHPPCYA